MAFTKPVLILAYIKSFFPRKGRKMNIQLHSKIGFTEKVLKATGFQHNFQYDFLYSCYLILLLLLLITIISIILNQSYLNNFVEISSLDVCL